MKIYELMQELAKLPAGNEVKVLITLNVEQLMNTEHTNTITDNGLKSTFCSGIIGVENDEGCTFLDLERQVRDE